jgi:hypothetical protein
MWLAVVLTCSACESQPVNPDMVPASGTVTYQGQPVANANVTFHSDTQGGFGLTDAQGRFQLQSISPDDGALPGTYPVSIIKMEVTAPKFDEGHPQYVPPPPPKYLVPKKYSDPRTSGLSATVERGKENEFKFELKD